MWAVGAQLSMALKEVLRGLQIHRATAAHPLTYPLQTRIGDLAVLAIVITIGCSQTNLVSQRPLDPNIHGHGRRYLDLTCGAQNDTQQNQECDAAHNDEALEHKNALSSKFKFTEKTQALLSKLESKTLELEKQKKELEAMQAAIEEYETDALTHRLDCRHCIDSLPCIYLDTIRLQLSDAFDGICAWE
ncbi:hypothetical protein BASA81_016835 [Batrachochytrium salamandrivorans]|nr:hypothetical protein BASA81_016835 [Batrachochytrium salamandrivorans]